VPLSLGDWLGLICILDSIFPMVIAPLFDVSRSTCARIAAALWTNTGVVRGAMPEMPARHICLAT